MVALATIPWVGGLGDDVLNGGEGRDEVSYQEVGSGPVRVDLGSLLPQDVGDQGFDTLLSIEVLRGTIYGDTLLGGAADESLYGGDGRDSLSGGAGHDLLSGGAYSDTLSGGLGNDSLIGGGPLVYWSGIDYVPAAGTDGDSLAGGLGDDTYEVTASSTEQYYSYAFGGTSGYGLQRGGTYAPDQGQEQPGEGIDTVQSYVSYVLPDNVENLQLMERSFDINGTGNALDNILTGNREANILDGGAGNDTMIGGAGEDTASYITAMSGVSVSLAIAGAQATGGSGSDTLISIENLIGSNFNDKLTGNSGANRLEGYAGNDTLDGGTGNDTMLGGDGNDYYYVRDSGDSVSETNATASIGGTDLVYSYLKLHPRRQRRERPDRHQRRRQPHRQQPRQLPLRWRRQQRHRRWRWQRHRQLLLWRQRHDRRHRQPRHDGRASHRRLGHRHPDGD
jgi:Ca2+-binding RTX toxin-like protein